MAARRPSVELGDDQVQAVHGDQPRRRDAGVPGDQRQRGSGGAPTGTLMRRHRGDSQREQADDGHGCDDSGHRHQRQRGPVDRHCNPPEDAGPGMVSSVGSRISGPMTSGVTTAGAVEPGAVPVEVITAEAPVGGGAVSTGVVAAAVPLSVTVCDVATPAVVDDAAGIDDVDDLLKLTVTSGESLTLTWVTGVRREIV